MARIEGSHHNSEEPVIDSRESFLSGLRDVIQRAANRTLEYRSIGGSPFDNVTGVLETNLPKYRKKLEEGVKEFLSENEAIMTKFRLNEEVEEIVEDAKQFKGGQIDRTDPGAHSGSDHHTGHPYY